MNQFSSVEKENECLRLEVGQLKEEIALLEQAPGGMERVRIQYEDVVEAYSDRLLSACNSFPALSFRSVPVMEAILEVSTLDSANQAVIQEFSTKDLETLQKVDAVDDDDVEQYAAPREESPTDAEKNTGTDVILDAEAQLRDVDIDDYEKRTDEEMSEHKSMQDTTIAEQSATIERLNKEKADMFHRQAMLDKELSRLEAQVELVTSLLASS